MPMDTFTITTTDSVKLESPAATRGTTAATRGTTFTVAQAVIGTVVVLAMTAVGGVIGASLYSSKAADDACYNEAVLTYPAPFDVSAGIDIAPSDHADLANHSSTRMLRSMLSFANTVRANYTLAAGMNSVRDENGVVLFTIATEVVVDMPFGEIATSDGRFDTRSIRLVVTSPEGDQTIVVPFGLSASVFTSDTPVVSLRPNFFFVQHVPATRRRLSLATDVSLAKAKAGEFATFASTYKGKLVAANAHYQKDLDNFVQDILPKYKVAAIVDTHELSDHVAQAVESSTRALSEFDSQVGSDIGSYVGNKYGGEYGGKYGGEVGSDIGGDIGSWAGGAAGGAIGGAIAGPIGADVGEDLGSWAGKEVGSWAGGKLGSDLGSKYGAEFGSEAGGDIGSDLGSWVSSW